MLAAVYNCFSLPFNVAFRPELMNNELFQTIDRIIDLVFCIDIIFNFRTTYIDDYGNEVKNPHKIALDYIKFFFWLDLIATVPIDTIVSYIDPDVDESI